MQKPIFTTAAAAIALAAVTTSPAQARYLQTDPIGYEDNHNLYVYVQNDPINGIDPRGEDTVVIYRAGQIEGAPDGYGHAYVEYRDPDTGESRIFRAGPSETPNMGIVTVISRSRMTGRDTGDIVTLDAVDTESSRSVDNGFGEAIDSVRLPDDFSDVQERAGTFADEVNSARIPYRALGPNSNTAAASFYEQVTGTRPENNSDLTLPGENLTVPPKPPKIECYAC